MKQDPIFIVGTGRCGSTMFHDVLSHHGDLAWLSNIVAKRPGKPRANALLNRALDLPGAAPVLRKLFQPSEPYVFWERYCKGFSRPYRDLEADDVIPGDIPKIRNAFDQAMPENKIPLAKITGWPRVRYLKEIFPDAKFVHIVRDGRAVVNSVLNAPYFDGWSGPEQWARGHLDEQQKQAWIDCGESFIVLAAIGWENRMRAFQEVRAAMSDSDYLEFRYEDFCANPREMTERTLSFLGLENSSATGGFLAMTESFNIASKNDKWKQDLSRKQQRELNWYLAPMLQDYGYNVENHH